MHLVPISIYTLEPSQILTDGYSVDHGSNFCDTPAKDDASHTQAILERCSEYDEADNIEGYSHVTCPSARVKSVRWAAW